MYIYILRSGIGESYNNSMCGLSSIRYAKGCWSVRPSTIAKTQRPLWSLEKPLFFYLQSLYQLPFNFYFIEESCAISNKVPI